MRYVREYGSVKEFELDIMNIRLVKNARLESWQAVQSESATSNEFAIKRELHFRIIAVFITIETEGA